MGGKAIWWIAPYAAWMIIMAVLPQNAVCYAIRGVITAFVLASAFFRLPVALVFETRGGPVKAVFAGAAAGAAVFFIWIAPETWFGLQSAAVAAADSPYSPEVCGMELTLAKLAASSLVIPIAEEMFFRKWLVDFAGFWWMVALFAVEHSDRWAVGAVAGAVYGLLARRFGLMSAIIAHTVTNLVLGLHVVCNGEWRFW